MEKSESLLKVNGHDDSFANTLDSPKQGKAKEYEINN